MTQGEQPQVKSGTIGQKGGDEVGSPGCDQEKGEGIFPLPLISTVSRSFAPRGGAKTSYIRSLASSQLLKFLIVGGTGVVVNLLMMALVFHTSGYRDWRASAIASTVAAVHNYLFNNYWTFADQRRVGRALFRGAFLYLAMSAAGVGITTLTYSILTQASFRAHFGTSSLYLYGAQLVSISFGTYLNYYLNKLFTWRSGNDGQKPRSGLHLGKVADELQD